MADFVLARALYAFNGEEANDLSFKEDDIVKVFRQDESGWWFGQTDDGRQGEFPYNYVEIVSAGDEARIREAATFVHGAQQAQATQTDTILSVQVTPLGGQSKFTIEARLSRKQVSAVKAMDEFRRLDEMLKFMYPNFDRPLPPLWADKVYENEAASRKKAKVLEIYLAKMLVNTGSGNELTEFALVTWISSRESFHCNPDFQNQVRQAFEEASRKNGGRNNYNQDQIESTVLARAEYPWDQKDAVELPLKIGSLIAVRNQNTYNEGWWEGEDTAGQRGLFPNNYVKLLEPREAKQVMQGDTVQTHEPVQAPTQNQYDMFQQSFNTQQPATKPVAGNRQRQTEANFAIPNLDAFDELLNDGFTMLENDNLLTKRPQAVVPRQGDTVSLSYVAFVWDCQNQKLIEFASSDLPDEHSNVGPLVFQVGAGKEIKALERAVQNLEKGQQSRVIVTPNLGYGEVGNPPSVPPNCHLVYDITLDGFESGNGAAQQTTGGYGSSNIVTNRPRRQHQQRVQQETNYNFGDGNSKKYSYQEMQQIVQSRTFEQFGINPNFLEDHLTDDAFFAAFQMSRTDFMLLQRWKRSKLKQDAGLY